MDFKEIYDDLSSIPNRKTKDIDIYNKKLIKMKTDVSFLKDYVNEYPIVYRTYFHVSLILLNDYKKQFEFIEENSELLQDWWHVDILMQVIKKPIPFDFAYEKASKYISSNLPFMRRWGYVLFLMGLHKEKDECVRILKLFKDDSEYYVQMGEAWLLAEMAIYNFDLVYDFIKNYKLKYNILGKAIQKICDSFRITADEKKAVKSLRKKLRNN